MAKYIYFIYMHIYIYIAVTSQITDVSIVYSIVYSGEDQPQQQSPQWPIDSPHKGPITRKLFPFDGVIMVDISFATRGHVNFTWHDRL